MNWKNKKNNIRKKCLLKTPIRTTSELIILMITIRNAQKKAGPFLTMPFDGRTCYGFTRITGTESNSLMLVALKFLFLEPDEKADKGRAQDDNNQPVIDSQSGRQSDLSEISPGQHRAL